MDPTQLVAASAAHLPPPPQLPLVSAVDHPTPVVNRPHPPYPEMIMAAIMWENSEGKQGRSTKKSISNFINRVYTGLPPFNSFLVACHLKRLIKSGQLVCNMCNTYQCTSFCTPRPESNKQHQCTQGQIPIESAPPQHQFHHPSPDSSAPHHSVTPTPNPEEAQAEAPSQAHFEHQQIASLLDLGEVSSVVVVNEASSRKRPRQSASEEENQLDQVVVPVIQLISEELNGSQVEFTLPEVLQPQPVISEHLPVDVQVVKRRRGRPAKVKVKVMGVVGVRRGRGRPRKNEHLEHLSVNEMGVAKRKREWPRKCKLPQPQAQSRPQVQSPVLLQELNSVLVKHTFGQGHGMTNDVLSRREDVELNSSQVELTLPEVRQPQPVLFEHLPVDVEVVKRRRGRPVKVKVKVMGVVGVRRRRGRPKKNEQPQPQAQSHPQPVYLEHLPVNEVGVVNRKQRWPRKCKLPQHQAQSRPQVQSPVQLQQLSSVLVKHTPGKGHEMANDVLSKQDDVQSKIREALGVIKPLAANHSTPDALTALQHLEQLLTTDLTPSSSPAPTSPPRMMMPMNLTDPAGTTVPLPSGSSVPSITVMEPLHLTSSIRNLQPMHWILILKKRALKAQ